MEHQNSWPGPSPELERLEDPRMLHPELPEVLIHQLPPPSQSPVSERRSIEPGAVPGFQRHRIYRRQSRAQPVESLVHKLGRHSLKSHYADILPGSAKTAPFRRHVGIPHVQGRPDHVLMDCDSPRDIVQESTVSATAAAQIEKPCDQIPANTLSPFTEYDPNVPKLEPEKPLSSTPAEFASMVMVPESTTTQHHVPLPEVDPKQELGCQGLDLDEGYGHGTNEFVWTNDGHSLIQSLASRARKSGALVYRTSSEAAMDCSQVVHKVPRMRRRRHKKNQTRLQASSSIKTCGIDSQDITTPSHPVDDKNQHGHLKAPCPHIP
ncbi:hypothetical protein J3459_006263 [Metarhizium acridum]|uniref:uncharacterized protein n=1 Tax=Metarhizium acridum TaxID=92637 RepID=UPI001C6C8FBA|nr:hypothetical protein J3458_005466 [Metarhizium acridum]KAG8427896.1 hypothetical protein J3459_006263 [Metarhizium acridum]